MRKKVMTARALAKRVKVPVTARALTQRINRALARAEEQLIKARGEYIHIDGRADFVIEADVNIEEMGKRLGVLRPYECLET